MVPKGVAYLLFKRVSGTVVIIEIMHVCMRLVGGAVRTNSYNKSKGQSAYESSSKECLVLLTTKKNMIDFIKSCQPYRCLLHNSVYKFKSIEILTIKIIDIRKIPLELINTHSPSLSCRRLQFYLHMLATDHMFSSLNCRETPNSGE